MLLYQNIVEGIPVEPNFVLCIVLSANMVSSQHGVYRYDNYYYTPALYGFSVRYLLFNIILVTRFIVHT